MSYVNEVPSSFNAGDTVEFAVHAFDKQGTELTAGDGYTLYVIFSNASHLYSASTTAYNAGDGFVFTIPSSGTSGYTAGNYNASIFVGNGTVRYQVSSKYVDVLPNLFAGTAVDSRSTVRKTLDALNAAILGAATDNQLSMSIAGRSIQRMSLEELLKTRQTFENLMASEERAKLMIDGKPLRNTISVRFK